MSQTSLALNPFTRLSLHPIQTFCKPMSLNGCEQMRGGAAYAPRKQYTITRAIWRFTILLDIA